MTKDTEKELLSIYSDALQAPYHGGFRTWAEDNVYLPVGPYRYPGKLDLSISPYLLKPAAAIDDPNIMQINLCMATQVGKSLLSETCIPYWVINAPGPIFRIFQSKELSDKFAEDRLIPLLKECPATKPLLKYNKFSTKKAGIRFPHTSVTLGSSNTSLAHGLSVRYLLCDELHEWEPGMFNKFLARTTAFSGYRKIICASQPNETGSEWENICHKGLVYEWGWCCPKCKTKQLFHWSEKKPTKIGSEYGGMNWETILNPDGSTNINSSAATTTLECLHCDHQVHDTPTERRQLNDTGDYICTKNDGDTSVVTYMAPGMVYAGISFKQLAAQYLIAKQMLDLRLDTQMQIFVTQSLGKFYRRQKEQEISKILVEEYAKEGMDKDWINVIGVDVQQKGGVKYYVVRSWNRNGNESRRLDFGLARTYEEIEALQKKYNVVLPMVHVDSGDGNMTQIVYQECLKRLKAIRLSNGSADFISWTPTKGDQKVNYKHSDDVIRYYDMIVNCESGFPQGHKLYKIPARLVKFSNLSLKTILGNLRDQRIPGVKWIVDHRDEEYDKQMYSEYMADVIDKKSGLPTKRWIENSSENHYFDCEVLCLLGAIRANVFSATKVNEEDIKALSQNPVK